VAIVFPGREIEKVVVPGDFLLHYAGYGLVEELETFGVLGAWKIGVSVR
jgi:hypothetical protein